ncbi:MAG TPA: ATP-dependent helicase [Flavobacteriales bacterium]|nr:ATP-dependent helicase [Flavobacteriales bacterium]
MSPNLISQLEDAPKSKVQYDEAFERELERLNPAQREAVDHIDGPVLVVAGPGTGKTHLLAARIGQILKTTDAQAYNILCLTYTDAGTIAMRQSLLDFIGPVAYRVNIYTFHAYCNDIIQRYPDYFGNRDLEPISELETVDLLMSLIDGLETSNPIKRKKGKIYFEVARLKDLFRKMKEESWTPEFIEQCIDEYLADLPLRDEYIYKRGNAKQGIEVGDVKQAAVDKEAEKMKMLRAGAQLFPTFISMMEAAGRYDYNDMILWVLNAFRKDEDFLRVQQEKFHYFLVDEFQDTNGAQIDLLNYLINFWDKPNVFAVGDDDQSIYEFQGARMKNIMDFYHRYERDIKVIVMEDNYRSSQHVLDASKTLIDNNRERLINQIENLTKTLLAKNDIVAKSDIRPAVLSYYNVKHEEAGIVDKLEGLQKQGVPLNEIAVIYRNHKQAAEIINLVEKKGIPYSVVKRIDILELPMINNLLTLLTYLSLESKKPFSGEHLLFEIMHYSFFNIDPHDAARLMVDCRTDWKRKLRNHMADPDIVNGLKLTRPDNITALGGNLNQWISDVSNVTFQMLFEKIINQGGLLKEIMNSPEKTWLMQVLITLFDFIKEESAKNPRIKVASFLDTISKMNINELKLGINKTVYEEDGINFLTAHSSKGLEFEYVFLIGADTKTWEKKKGAMFSYSLPDTLTLSSQENILESGRRLFYVAMTRAKEHLEISFSKQNQMGKDIEKTLFVAEVLENGSLEIEDQHLSGDRLTELSFESLEERVVSEVPLLDTEYINQMLENYSMSVTHLNKYLRCPVSFYYDNIIRVPRAKNKAMSFGSAVHVALKHLFDKMQECEGIFPDAQELVDSFMKDMNKNRGSFSDADFEGLKAAAEEDLPAYYDQWVKSWNKTVLCEFSINNVEMDGIPLNGKLDKLEFNKNNVNVVDYKTGSVVKGLKKLRGPDDKNPLGGEYWRQLYFYKILMDEIRPKQWTMVSGEIDFIEKDERNKKEFVKRQLDVTNREGIIFVKEQIRETYNKIMNHEFTEGCGDKDCGWCNFAAVQFQSKEPVPHNEDLEV